MSEAEAGRAVLLLTLAIVTGFGLLVSIWSIIARKRGESARPIWIKYLAWFVIIPPILIPLVYSRSVFQGIVLLLSLLCFREYTRVTGLWSDRRLVGVCYLAIVAIYYPVFTTWYGLYQAMPLYAIALVLALPVIRDTYEHMIQKVCLSVLGVIYFGWFFSHLAYLRNVEHGIAYIFLLLVLVESNDAFGYLWGTLLGRHKLAPRISPHKTIEGTFAAAASVMVLAWLLRYLVPSISTPHLLLLTFILAVFGTCGDLTISYIKRDLGIKDTGALIPGHGGLLDRFDSILFTAPLYFHFLRYFYGRLSDGW
jgi:phosphatidate cytidylyltransferase